MGIMRKVRIHLAQDVSASLERVCEAIQIGLPQAISGWAMEHLHGRFPLRDLVRELTRPIRRVVVNDEHVGVRREGLKS